MTDSPLTYRETIIPKAAAAWALHGHAPKERLFVNVYRELEGDTLCVEERAVTYELNDAALEASAADGYYVGTIAWTPERGLEWLDLSAHGEALGQEDEQDRMDELRHQRELRERWAE